MTKSELIARLAERFPQLVAKDADYAVKMILDAITAALVRAGIASRSAASAVLR
jgi:integration host factor subunit beta